MPGRGGLAGSAAVPSALHPDYGLIEICDLSARQRRGAFLKMGDWIGYLDGGRVMAAFDTLIEGMGQRIEWHRRINSTMRAAAALAEEGCESGTVVGADEQTAGQGRQGRTWHSPAGAGLYFTQVLRLKVPAAELPVVTLALGLAVKDALEMFAHAACDLRWPNDVMINGRKVAGILTVLHKGAILAGIGLNVSQTEFPAEIREAATSLALETGRAHDKQVLLRAILNSTGSYTRMLETGGVQQILGLFAAASTYVEGMNVIVDTPVGAERGITAGLTRDGLLRLRKEDGTEVTITAGGVRPAPED